MHVEQTTGQVPGIIYATIRHGTTHRTIPVMVERTEIGRFKARMPDQRWSPDCATMESAILMHAAIVFPIEIEAAPWLATPRSAPRHAFLNRHMARDREQNPDYLVEPCISEESV